MARLTKITDFDLPELDVYARLTENQLLNRQEPEKGLFIAESPKVIARALDAGYVPVSLLLEEKQAEGEAREILSRCEGIPVYTAPPEVLSRLTGFPMTRGALCALRRPALPTVEAICRDASRIAVLEDVVNPTNLGAIFRSAAALGMDAILLTPACSNPLYRRASRVSMGTVFQIPWTYLGGERQKDSLWPQPGISLLRKMGFRTVAMALCQDSICLEALQPAAGEKLAVILGAEGDGLSPKTIAQCDCTVRIPMSHGVDSLNVAAASAVVFWKINRSCGLPG